MEQKPAECARLIVVAPLFRSVSIFGSGGEHLHTLPSLQSNITSVVWTGDAELAVASGPSIHTWSISAQKAAPKAIYTGDLNSHIVQMAVSPDKSKYAAAMDSGVVGA